MARAVITELDLADDATAAAVHAVARRGYAVEAELIGFDGIPPLRESLDEMRALPLRWLGHVHTGRPVAFVGWSRNPAGEVDVDRVCVDPDHFRRGLARALITRLLEVEPAGDVLVSTGAANTPAVNLYLSLRFERVGDASPAPGLTIARFRLRRPSG